MERFSVTMVDGHIAIGGCPDAARAIGIDGPKGRRLSHLDLHRSDLGFAAKCLGSLNSLHRHTPVLREAAWRSAIVHFLKCFGHSKRRFQLDAGVIYKGNTPALAAFDYFQHLRDKHLVHDENAWAQSLPCAVLAKRGKPHKIAKIVCVCLTGRTLNQGNYGNLSQLIEIATRWVQEQFEAICRNLTEELETQSYEDLSSRPAPMYRAPRADEVGDTKP